MPLTTLHQTTSPWVGVTDFLGRLLGAAGTGGAVGSTATEDEG